MTRPLGELLALYSVPRQPDAPPRPACQRCGDTTSTREMNGERRCSDLRCDERLQRRAEWLADPDTWSLARDLELEQRAREERGALAHWWERERNRYR